MNALKLLTDDHQRVARLFKNYENASGRDRKQSLFNALHEELSVHARIEEDIFYPEVKEASSKTADAHLREAWEEHHVMKTLLRELSAMTPANEQFDAKVKVLMENVEHHVEEEQTQLFADARRLISKARLEELGAEMEAHAESLRAGGVGAAVMGAMDKVHGALLRGSEMVDAAAATVRRVAAKGAGAAAKSAAAPSNRAAARGGTRRASATGGRSATSGRAPGSRSGAARNTRPSSARSAATRTTRSTSRNAGKGLNAGGRVTKAGARVQNTAGKAVSRATGAASRGAAAASRAARTAQRSAAGRAGAAKGKRGNAAAATRTGSRALSRLAGATSRSAAATSRAAKTVSRSAASRAGAAKRKLGGTTRTTAARKTAATRSRARKGGRRS